MPEMFARDYDKEEITSDAAPDMPNLHALLEEIKVMDRDIAKLEQRKSEAITFYHQQIEKLAAHYEKVVTRNEKVMNEPSIIATESGRRY